MISDLHNGELKISKFEIVRFNCMSIKLYDILLVELSTLGQFCSKRDSYSLCQTVFPTFKC